MSFGFEQIGNIGFGAGVLLIFLFFVVSGIIVLGIGIELVTKKSIEIIWQTLVPIIYFLGMAGLILIILFGWSEMAQTFIQTGAK